MRTRPLFYEEPDIFECDATVLEVLPPLKPGDGAGLILDRSPFYPEGGGQPCDLGSVAGIPLARVAYEGDDIVHRRSAEAVPGGASGSAALPAAGALVPCMLDAARRRDHTEQHSAQHLLSATVLRLLGGATRSFHLGEEYSSIDVDLPAMERDDADAVEAAVLDVLREGYAVITHLCPPEDPARFPLRRKPPEGESILRILEIDGLDYTPCAGTHVKNTRELGAFRILRTEKYKGMTRVYFLAGGRAHADYARAARQLRDAAAAAGTNEGDVARWAGDAARRAKDLEYRLKQAREALARAEAQALAASSTGGPIGITLEGEDFSLAMLKAKACADAGLVAAVASVPELKAAIAAPGGGVNLQSTLKDTLAAHGGKGGGSAAFFQAAFADRERLDAFMEEALCRLR